MPIPADHTLRIFLGSPGDLDMQRQWVREVVHSLDVEFKKRSAPAGSDARFRIDLLAWEDVETPPAGVMWQDLIDRRLNYAQCSQLAVFLFSTRLGSPMVNFPVERKAWPEVLQRHYPEADGTWPTGSAWEHASCMARSVQTRHLTEQPWERLDVYAFRENVCVDRQEENETQWEMLTAYLKLWKTPGTAAFQLFDEGAASEDTFKRALEQSLRPNVQRLYDLWVAHVEQAVRASQALQPVAQRAYPSGGAGDGRQAADAISETTLCAALAQWNRHHADSEPMLRLAAVKHWVGDHGQVGMPKVYVPLLAAHPEADAGHLARVRDWRAERDYLLRNYPQFSAGRIEAHFLGLTEKGQYGKARPDQVDTLRQAYADVDGQHDGDGYQTMLSWISEGSLYLAAGPGGGKTTFSTWLQWVVARADGSACEPPDLAPPSLNDEALHGGDLDRLPPSWHEQVSPVLQGRAVLVLPLRDLGRFALPAALAASGPLTVAMFWAWVQAWYEAQGAGLALPALIAQIAAGAAAVAGVAEAEPLPIAHRLVLVLDGLDELRADPAPGRVGRRQVCAVLKALHTARAWQGLRLMVTARAYALTPAEVTEQLSLPWVQIAALPPVMQRALARRFCLAVAPTSMLQAQTDALLAEIERRRADRETAFLDTALMLTALCALFHHRYQQAMALGDLSSDGAQEQPPMRLPHTQAGLLMDLVRAVMHNRELAPLRPGETPSLSAEHGQRLLTELATCWLGRQDGPGGSLPANAPEPRVLEAYAKVLTALGRQDVLDDELRHQVRSLQRLAEDTGLLKEGPPLQGQTAWGYVHNSFRDVLLAQAWACRLVAGPAGALLPAHFPPQHCVSLADLLRDLVALSSIHSDWLQPLQWLFDAVLLRTQQVNGGTLHGVAWNLLASLDAGCLSPWLSPQALARDERPMVLVLQWLKAARDTLQAHAPTEPPWCPADETPWQQAWHSLPVVQAVHAVARDWLSDPGYPWSQINPQDPASASCMRAWQVPPPAPGVPAPAGWDERWYAQHACRKGVTRAAVRHEVALLFSALDLDDRAGVIWPIKRVWGRAGWQDVPQISVAWVDVSASTGEVRYGDEPPGDTYGFAIAAYPVTIAQFAVFEQADDGWCAWRRWAGQLGWPQAMIDGPVAEAMTESVRMDGGWWKTPPTAAREAVSWWAARLFCAWLEARLRAAGRWCWADGRAMPEHWTLRLPMEREWERVARGTDNRLYAMGQTFVTGQANVAETLATAEEKLRQGPASYLERTSVVGLYPPSALSAGGEPRVWDLDGNVQEWCENVYDREDRAWDAAWRLNPATDALVVDEARLDGEAVERAVRSVRLTEAHHEDWRLLRAARGGAWINRPVVALAALRNGGPPDFRDNGLGFRVCCAPPFSKGH